MSYPSGQITDIEIVSLIKERDIKGINALYDQYGSYLLRYVSEIISSKYFSEVALQNSYLKVWNNIDSYAAKKGRFLTWVINISRNSAIDVMRSKHYRQSIKLISLDSIVHQKSEFSFDLKIENMDLREIVTTLDPKYRELIDMVYFKGYTHVEVAKELDVPLGTVKTRIRKAFGDLRVILS